MDFNFGYAQEIDDNEVSLLINSTDEVVKFTVANLPDVQDLKNLLTDERVPLDQWVNLALLYYKNERYAEFETLLEQSMKSAPTNYQNHERDQMRALDMLAAYYLQRGREEKTAEGRKDWTAKAAVLYSTADKIIMYDQNHLLGRAYCCLLEGQKTEQADAQFNFVLSQTNNDERLTIPAMMGRAAILYMKKDYKHALTFYKKCLEVNPACPASVRAGIGYCLIKLGKPEKAKIAFSRAIELNPDDVDSQAALAVLHMTNAGDGEEMRQGILSLGALYRKEKDHPLILNHLANHFFIKSELDDSDKDNLLMKAKKLLNHATSISRNDQILAEANFHLGRCYHAQNEIADAHRHYYQACQFQHPKFVLPQYGYGQTSILLGDTEKAIEAFEKVLKVQPNSSDVQKILGALYAHAATSDKSDKPSAANEERREKAKTMLAKAVEAAPDDLDVLIDLAVLLQKSDPQTSLEMYTKIIDRLRADDLEIPPEILNNMGVLNFNVHNDTEAREYFINGRETILLSEMIDEHRKASLVVLAFNLARTNERLQNFSEAERIYIGILKKLPRYINANFRLSCMKFATGDSDSAVHYLKEIIAVDEQNPDAWLMYGLILFDQNQLGAAQKKFEHVLKIQKYSTDPIALVAMGNIWLKMLFDVNRQREKDQINRDRALQFFLKALRVAPKNIYAAHGAACILAQRGDLTSARDVLGQVREGASDYADVWLNMANVHVDTNQYQSASQLYQTCIRRFQLKDNVEMFFNIAFVYYKMGKHQLALDFLDRAIILDPGNLVAIYNHAFVGMKYASDILENNRSNRIEVKDAIEKLQNAESAFREVASSSNEKVASYRYISRTVCSELASKCADLLTQSESVLAAAEKLYAEERKMREQQEMERRRVIEEHKREARRKAEEERERAEELKKRRQMYIEKTKEALKMPEIQDEPQPRRSAGGSRKRKRANEENSGFINDTDEDEVDPQARRKKKMMAKRKAQRDDRAFINDSTDDEEGGGKKRRRRKEKNPEEVDEDLHRFKGKVKSKAIVEDSSSSSESEGKKSGSDAPVARPSSVHASSDSDDAEVRRKIALSSSSDDEEMGEPTKKKVVIASDSDDDRPVRTQPTTSPSSQNSDDGERIQRIVDSDASE